MIQPTGASPLQELLDEQQRYTNSKMFTQNYDCTRMREIAKGIKHPEIVLALTGSDDELADSISRVFRV